MSVPDATTDSFKSVIAKVDEAYKDITLVEPHEEFVPYAECPMHLCDGMLSKILWFQNDTELSHKQIKMIFDHVLTEEQRQIIVNTVNSKDNNVRFWWED